MDNKQGKKEDTTEKEQINSEANNITEKNSLSDNIETINICNGYLYIGATIKDKYTLGLIDTGASRNILSARLYLKIPNLRIEKIDLKLRSAEGKNLKIYGVVRKLPVEFKEGLTIDLEVIICEIEEDFILGNKFLGEQQVTIDYNTLLLGWKGNWLPILQLRSQNHKGVIENVMEKNVHGQMVITCRATGHDLKLPCSYVYRPDPTLWGETEPVIINLCSEIFEIKINNPNKLYPIHLSEGELIGTIEEVDKSKLFEDIDTWNLPPKIRVEKIIEQLKLEDNEYLTPEQKQEVKLLIAEFHDIWSLSKKEIGITSLYTHKIYLKDDKPVQVKNRPIPMHNFAEVQKTISEMIDMGVLEPSSSPYRAPLLLVGKKDGSKRMCVDYRALNLNTIDIQHPLPTIQETRSVWADCKYYSTLDLTSAYHQIPLCESSRDCTTIWVNGIGALRHTRVPMGAKGSGSALQALTDLMFRDLRKSICCNYLDDIISGSKTFQSMMENLRLIFERIRWANLKIKAKKSEIFKDHVFFLGVKLSSEGLRANLDKINDLINMEFPKNKKGLQRFLGLGNYFRQFIPSFSEIALGLTNALKGEKFKPDEEARKSFEALKKALTNPPVLAWPCENKPFKLYCDASKMAIGFVLVQDDEKGNEKPVSYGSRCLGPSQILWPSFVKEFWACYTAIKRLRYYLYGKKFTLYTDCKGLTFEKTLRKGTTDAVLRWCLDLSQYEFDIKYIKGEENIISDCMSRLPSKTDQLYDFFVKNFIKHYQKKKPTNL